MNLRAMSFAIGALMLSSSAAFADCAAKTESMTTTTLQTTFDPSVPAIVQPSGFSETAYTNKSDVCVNQSLRNMSNDSGDGSQNFSTIGVDYGVGPNVTGATGNIGLAIGNGCNMNGKLRSNSVGFAPHKKRYMIYDNNVSVALPMIR